MRRRRFEFAKSLGLVSGWIPHRLLQPTNNYKDVRPDGIYLMIGKIKNAKMAKRVRRSILYSRIRQYFPMSERDIFNDRDQINNANIILIDWPESIKKPKFGIVQDYYNNPRWTKYCRFLDNNSFEYEIYNIHNHNWIEKVEKFDIVVGVPSSAGYDLQEIQKKYYVLEKYLGKTCFPSLNHATLYEDKVLEAFILKAVGLPFANTYISYNKKDAMCLIERLKFPIVSKIIPGSGSFGVELVRSQRQCKKIVDEAFSLNGRKTHLVYFRQKDYVYFQEYIPNDGYDIRAIVIGNWVFGYYRKVLEGDFRASGMNLVEKRALPEEAMRIALEVNKTIKSPMLVVDMLHSLDGRYYIIEYSPLCMIETPEQLHVNDIPGVYIFADDGSCYFEEGRYWVHELALRKFLLDDYLPKVIVDG